MKKILSDLAEKKGLSLPQLAERLGMHYQTLYGYDRGTRRMPAEFAERAGKYLGVSGAEILQSYAELKDDAPPYHTTMVPVELLPDEVLGPLLRHLATRLPESAGMESGRIIEALRALNEEKQRRGQRAAAASAPAGKEGNPAYRALNSISPELAATSVAQAQAALDLEAGKKGSAPSSATGGTSGHKHGTSQSSGAPARKKQTPRGPAQG